MAGYKIIEDVGGECHKVGQELKKQGHEVEFYGFHSYGNKEVFYNRNKKEQEDIIIVSYSNFCTFCHGEESIKDLCREMNKWKDEGRAVFLIGLSSPCDIDEEKFGLGKFDFFLLSGFCLMYRRKKSN